MFWQKDKAAENYCSLNQRSVLKFVLIKFQIDKVESGILYISDFRLLKLVIFAYENILINY